MSPWLLLAIMMAPKAAQQRGDVLWDPSWTEGAGEQTIRERSADLTAPVTLYCSWFCPFAQRAWLALEEKQVQYRYVEVNPYEVDPNLPGGYTKKALPLAEKKRLMPAFISASPRGLVPAVANSDESNPVWESLHVVRYIDEAFDGPALFPTDPVKRAYVGIWSDHCTDRVQKSYYKMLMDQDPDAQDAAREDFYLECRRLANAMDPLGPFFLGKDVCMVDIALAPFWQRIHWVGGHYRGLTLPNQPEFQRLDKWWQAMQNRPAFQRTLVSKPRLISSYSQYARNEGTSDYARNLASSLSKQAVGNRLALPLAFTSGAALAAVLAIAVLKS